MNRLCQALLSLSLLSLACAQPLLSSYEGAKTALGRSLATMPDDAVASLDALRQAREAFTPLAEGLEPTLRDGLEETFSRAEQAIVNESQTDLRVQASVLRGGFERGLYESALESSAAGNLDEARARLEVLATDLQLTPRTFSGDSAQSLQTSFEQRLASRSLAELDALSELPGDDRGGLYERLSQLYSYVFVVQDSPRLPAQTQGAIIEAIRRHIARQPIASNLSALRTLLQSFESAAAAAQPGGADPTTEPQPASLEPRAPAGSAATPVPQSAPLRTYLFMVVGLLALVAISRLLLRVRASSSPWQDAATALLLLPALIEGVLALGQWLGQLLGLPLLAGAGSLSLFNNPITQLVSGVLIACAALCLVLARRSTPASLGEAQRTPQPGPVRTSSPQTKTSARPPFANSGKMNWDEDF